MGIQITTRALERIIVVDAVGRLTFRDSHTHLRDLIYVLCSNGHRRFLLNLAEVDFIDSDGLGELVRCYTSVRQRGCEMKLVHPNKHVQNLFNVTRLNTFFEIYAEEHVALQAFGESA